MKYCSKCGAKNEDHASVCQECGSLFSDIHYSSQSNGPYTDPNGNQAMPAPRPFGIEPRSIILCIIFTIITCGIYGIYWIIKLNDEVNALAGETGATTGGMVFLFTLITCGIYGWYWLYKMGERCDRIKNTNSNSNILFLILGIVGLSIISYCLIQDTINQRVQYS